MASQKIKIVFDGGKVTTVDLIVKDYAGVFHGKGVTGDVSQLLDKPTQVGCSAFGEAIYIPGN